MTAPAAGGRARGLGASIALLAVARLSTVVAFFAINVVAARLLDPAQVGAAAVGQTIGLIAGLVGNGGLNIATIYFLQQRPDERRTIVPALTGLAAIGASVAFVAVLVSAPLVFALVLGADAWLLLGAAGLMGAGMIAYEFGGALLLGLGHRPAYTLAELVRGWGSLVAVALLVFVLREDWGLVLGMALGYAGGALLAILRSRGETPIRPRLDRRLGGEALRFGLRGQVGNVFQFLGVRLDLLLVPAFLDLSSAGIYFVAVRVSDVVGQVATAAASLVFPQVAGQQDRRATATTERIVRATLLVVVATAAVVALLAEPILGIAFGEPYVAGASVLLLALVGIVPLSLGRMIASDLKGRGRPGLVSLSALLSVGTTLAFDVALIPALGIRGAAIAAVLSNTATAIALLLAYRSVTDGRLVDLVPRPSDAVGLVSRLRLAGRGPEPGA